MYAYLRSQVGSGDPSADEAEGLLLHPSLGESVDETVVYSGAPHSIYDRRPDSNHVNDS